ncbi:DUF4006 family protein [Helicobacter saguini]|uniref:DUF4006 family protein n=1 Tax=Helicobacter saguini TaxID=1548018 RepID=A0A347VR23_9HELI|nr:DUF4006 family protein [Helicobacter saguini]MWV63064.1 DUF4006 family protein [Helicobacter saguini]MWV66267.1 DUF4006 family protein [Helicobacter saguini]MWV68619.1 DUF4006 family protein [Helicobacter saguini]MWV71830.1 DUF4006 family protein [Helicobacter saguini]TLD95853.1 DUF4006 family protein [Helicobacter saguini]
MQTIVNILNSLVGYLLAVLLVVGAAAIVGYNAIRIQSDTATKYYTLDTQDLQKKNTANQNAFKPLEK